MSLKPRLGDIATPGRVCPPHNETYDCRLRPNGIGCLRRGGGSGAGRPAARPAGQEPAFRADPTSERNDLPIRSVRFSIRANGKPRRAAIPATRRKTREKKRDEFPGYRPETYRAPGDRTGNAAGERDRSVCESDSALRSPGARKARATGLRAVRVGLSRQKRRASPEHLQTRLHTLLHQPFWEVFSAHTFRWLETLWHGAGWKILALGTFGILMRMIGLPNTSPYRNPDKKQGSFL